MNINEPRHGGGFTLPFINTSKASRKSHRPGSLKSNRLPFLEWVPDSARNHFVATSAEYAGTTLFLFFAFSGTQVALLATPTSSPNVVGAVSDPSQLMYIALSFGFSLAVNAWVFFRISGGLFNPAVTLGMCLVGALPYIRGLFLLVAQILGGITAAAICSALFPGPLTVRTNLGGGTSVVQGLFIEMFLTAELVFTIFMLAAEKHKGTFIAPVGIGLSLFIAELTGVYFTGGSVNPARSFGPSVVSHQFHSYHWIYWVGPILGALLASGFYKFIKMLEYETANPGQDRSKPEGEHFNPDLDPMHPRVSFAPEDYAMEEGRSGRPGTPKEYGTSRRPFSDSPAPPHPNDQFAGLSNGMHHDEIAKPTNSFGGDSDRTLEPGMGNEKISHTRRFSNSQAIADRNNASYIVPNDTNILSDGTGSNIGGSHVNGFSSHSNAGTYTTAGQGNGLGYSSTSNTASNTLTPSTSNTAGRRKAVGSTGSANTVTPTTHKSALKPGTTAATGPRTERSVKSNTYNNRNMNDFASDEVFYDKN